MHDTTSDTAPLRLDSQAQHLLKMLAAGYSIADISVALGLTRHAVNGLLTALRQTAKARNTVALVAMAIQAGAVRVEEFARPTREDCDGDH